MRILLVLGFCASMLAADDVVFRGVPAVRVLSTADADDRQKIEGDAAKKNECVVVSRGNKYFWASRGNAPMTRVDAQQFTYFVHTGGAGYVKVYTGPRGSANATADYLEHINNAFEAITYWGRALTTGGTAPRRQDR